MQQNVSEQVSKRFGSNVKLRREALKMTQRKLSELLSYSGVRLDSSAIARIEAGTREPRLSESLLLAKTLGLDFDDAWNGSAPDTSVWTVRGCIAEAREQLAQALEIVVKDFEAEDTFPVHDWDMELRHVDFFDELKNDFHGADPVFATTDGGYEAGQLVLDLASEGLLRERKREVDEE